MKGVVMKMNKIYFIAWIFVPLIAIGGLFIAELGLLVMLVMLALMGIGLVNGRYFCGNICPHGSLFDNIITKVSFSRKIPKFFRNKFLKWGFFILFMSMFVLRFISALTASEGALTANLGAMFVMQYLIMPTILGVSLAILINPRTWCSFCPMGTMAQLMSKLGNLLANPSRITITQPDECIECGACAKACPMQLEPYKNFDDDNQFKDDMCIKCSECVKSCPVDILELN